ncbi:hypothetical protein D3C85_1874730 [compost metagenome]
MEAAGVQALPFRQEAFTRQEESAQDGSLGCDDMGVLAGFYLNLRKISIYGGTDEVQKNIISKLALGL